MRAAKSMVKGKGHDRGTLAKGKASSSAASEAQKGWAAWYLDNCKASLDKRQKLFEEKYSAFKQGSIEDVDCKAWLYIAKFAYLLGLDILCSPKCPTRTDHFVSSPYHPEGPVSLPETHMLMAMSACSTRLLRSSIVVATGALYAWLGHSRPG